MNTEGKNEYSEIMNMFNALTPQEAKQVLDFIQNLRADSNNSNSERGDSIG